MSIPLQIAERAVGGVVILSLHGRLVFEEGDRILRDRVARLINDGKTAILIDLEDVSYMDSGGIGTLVQMYTRLTERGGQLKLLHPSWHAARVLQITQLTSVFQIYDDEAAALRGMTAPVG